MYIEKFIQENYSDEKLAAALAHCEDGKFAFYSCCCAIGMATADHALRGKMAEYGVAGPWNNVAHYKHAKTLLYAEMAEAEVLAMGTDRKRIASLVPIFRAEIERRDALRKAKQELDEKHAWANAHARAFGYAEIAD